MVSQIVIGPGRVNLSFRSVAAVLAGAARYVDPARILACTNCGMAPLPRAASSGKLRALGAGASLARKRFARRPAGKDQPRPTRKAKTKKRNRRSR